jgi:hypothetical protein
MELWLRKSPAPKKRKITKESRSPKADTLAEISAQTISLMEHCKQQGEVFQRMLEQSQAARAEQQRALSTMMSNMTAMLGAFTARLSPQPLQAPVAPSTTPTELLSPDMLQAIQNMLYQMSNGNN